MHLPRISSPAPDPASTTALGGEAVRDCATCPANLPLLGSRGAGCLFVPRDRVRGSILFLRGQPAHTVWFVKAGTVALSCGEGGEPDTPWTLRLPGTLVGQEALTGTVYADTARAVTPVSVCGAHVQELRKRMLVDAESAGAMLDLSLRTHAADVAWRRHRTGTARARLAGWIVAQRDPIERTGVPWRDLAGLLGMTPETLSRTLRAFQSEDLVHAMGSAIRVVAPTRLAEIARGEGADAPIGA